MPQDIMVKVKPKVIQWAIDSSGWETEELAKQLQVTGAVITNWKTRTQSIELKKLEKLSLCIKRPLAVFFLENPPKESELTDYRKLPHEQTAKLSKNTIIKIRHARYLQAVAEELLEIQNMNVKPKTTINITLQTSAESAAKKERKKLGFESRDVLLSKEARKSIRDYYNVLRRKIESLNIFVFQAGMPITEIRGITLSDKFPRIIMINSKDTIQARIFSLLHEYGHVLLRKEGMCTPQIIYKKNKSDNNLQAIEKWCNNFAAFVLMPKEEFLTEYNRLKENELEPKKIIDKLAQKFKTSKHAAAIRISSLENNPISSQYRHILNEMINEIDKTKPMETNTGGPNVIDLCISQKGRKFISLVLESKRNEFINNSDMIDYLGMNLEHMKKLEEKTFRID